MRAFAYASPRSLDEAIALLDSDADGHAGGTRLLAGGTDLLTMMQADLIAPERLVDIKRLAELDDRIEDGPDGLTIGALATLAELEEDPFVQSRCPILAEAAGLAATPQLRNMATLGGNLLQRPRCWYFRDSRVHCWLKGGDTCYARGGENQHHALFDVSPCVAVHPSDPATALLALDAAARLRGPSGEREIPLAELFAPPEASRRRETTQADDEVIVSVRIPPQHAEARGVYLKAMERKVWAFAMVSVAAVLRLEQDKIAGASVALGGVAPVPWRAREAEQVLAGGEPTSALFDRAAEAALAGAEPLAKNGYKLPLAKALLHRALADLAGQPAG
jgi:xanthine dehydrogenase YagS FAD-binding subunit